MTVENFGMEFLPVKEELLKELSDSAGHLIKIAEKQCNDEKLSIEAWHLDKLYPSYKRGTFWNKKKRNWVVDRFGATLGVIMGRDLNFHWVMVRDKKGKELAIKNDRTEWVVFPFR